MSVRKTKIFWSTSVALLLVAAAWLWWSTQHQQGPTAKRATPEKMSCALPVQLAASPHPGMVWVPAGSFELGDTVYPEEQPLRKTSVAGFWMDRTEVTNAEFAEFVKAAGYITEAERGPDLKLYPGLPADMRQPGAVVFVMPKDVNTQGSATQWWRYVAGANWRHPGGPATSIEAHESFPVVAVSFADAKAYAQWKGRSLPSEAQWEWAARAGQAQAARDHEQPKAANTWQGIFPVVNSGEDGFVGLAPVGCYAPNALGLFDMIGNVWELTSDAYRPGHGESASGPPDQVPRGMATVSARQRVIKGGSFLCSPDYCMRYRSGARQPQDDDLGASHLGFRTVLLAPGP